MPFFHPFRCRRSARRRLAAFTLTELLVVLAVVALLACLHLPALARVKTQTWITQCSGNLRQVTLSFLLYGYDNGGQIYTNNIGFWPWDLPVGYFPLFQLYTGGQTNAFYCPSNPLQNLLWSFGGNYHTTGYAYTFPGAGASNGAYGGGFGTNVNPSVTPAQMQLQFPGSAPVVPAAAKRALVADAEICAGPTYSQFTPISNYNFTDVQGHAPAFADGRYHRASHLAGSFPLGGNLGMLDGHVEWRPFRSATYNMVLRNVGQVAPGTPCFMW